MRGTVSALCAGILCAVPAACVDRAETLLHDAARTGDFSEVKALTKAGADPKARAEFGLSPLHYAALGNGNPSVFKALIEAKSPNPGILTMLGNGSPLVVKALLNAGADPNARAEYGLTPLYNAAIAAFDPSIVEALIESGADPNARVGNGYTPLHMAAQTSGPSVVEALLDAGADPKARAEYGRIPFDYADDNKALQGTDAYRRLQEGRFE